MWCKSMCYYKHRLHVKYTFMAPDMFVFLNSNINICTCHGCFLNVHISARARDKKSKRNTTTLIQWGDTGHWCLKFFMSVILRDRNAQMQHMLKTSLTNMATENTYLIKMTNCEDNCGAINECTHVGNVTFSSIL